MPSIETITHRYPTEWNLTFLTTIVRRFRISTSKAKTHLSAVNTIPFYIPWVEHKTMVSGFPIHIHRKDDCTPFSKVSLNWNMKRFPYQCYLVFQLKDSHFQIILTNLKQLIAMKTKTKQNSNQPWWISLLFGIWCFPHSLGIHSLLFNYYEHIFILHDFMDPKF